jgi:hypothetical protein
MENVYSISKLDPVSVQNHKTYMDDTFFPKLFTSCEYYITISQTLPRQERDVCNLRTKLSSSAHWSLKQGHPKLVSASSCLHLPSHPHVLFGKGLLCPVAQPRDLIVTQILP